MDTNPKAAHTQTTHKVENSAGEIPKVAIESSRQKVSWGAIFAGSFVAIAVTILLGFLGAGFGLWAVEPGGESDSIGGMATTTMIYLIIAQLAALFVGGYIASRMSAAWDKQNAILHGAVVWALATITAILMAASAVGSIFYTSVTVVQNAASAVATATAAVVPDELPDFSMPHVSMDDLPPRIQKALRRQGITAENLKAEAREAFREVISKEEQAAAREIAMDAAVDAIRTPSDTMSDLDTAIDNLVGKGGVISPEEREELVTVMEERLGITESEAEVMIERWQKKAKVAYNDAREALQTAKEEAIEAGDAATDALSAASFRSFFALLLGLAAAAGGAAVGRSPYPN